MALIKWNPAKDLQKTFNEDFVPMIFGRNQDLAIDLYEDNGNLIAEMNIPGMKPENLEINVEGEYLTISGDREEKKENKDKDYYYQEIQRGSFQRTLRLPHLVNENAATAEYEDGTLKIVMPEVAKNKTKNKIPVNKKK